MFPINQVQVIYSTEALKTIYTKRTWKDRLFGWPWQPWKTSKEVKKPTMYLSTTDTSLLLNRKVIIAHPTFQAAIEKELDKQQA